MPNSADQLLAAALAPARAFMEEGDYDDLTTKLENVSEALLALDTVLAAGGPLPERWER